MSETYINGHPLDECSCADYRRDHEGGIGPCRVCLAINAFFLKKCQSFQLSHSATQEDVDKFKKLGIEYPEVKQ